MTRSISHKLLRCATAALCFTSSNAWSAYIDFEPLTNGQLQIGSTGNASVPATLSQGPNACVSITNGAGSITLDTVQDIRTSATPTFAGLNDSALTTGSVLFSGASGLISQANTKLFWDNTNNRLGIGTLTGVESMDSALTISNNVSTLPDPLAGTYNLVHIGSLDGVSNSFLFDSFGGTSQQVMRRSDGTNASPTAVQTGDILGQYLFYGYGATSYQTSGAAKIVSTAAENFSDTTGAAILQFYTRPSGTVAASTERMRIDQNGDVGINTTATATANLNVYNTYTLGNSPAILAEYTGVNTFNYNRPIEILAPNMDSNSEIDLLIGQADGSNNNSAFIGFNYLGGAGSATNYVGIGLYGSNDTLNVTGNKTVGIGNKSPSFTLDVTGSIRATTSITDSAFTVAQAGAPLSVTSSQVLSSGITNTAVTSTTATTSGTTAAALLTTTPAAGTYMVTYSGNITASSGTGNILTISFYVGGAQQTQTVRATYPYSTAAFAIFQNTSIADNAILTVNGSQAIALYGVTNQGTVTTSQREMDLVRVQ